MRYALYFVFSIVRDYTMYFFKYVVGRFQANYLGIVFWERWASNDCISAHTRGYIICQTIA